MELRTDRFKLKDVFPDRAGRYAQRLHIKADDLDYVRKAIPLNPEETTIEEGERAAIRLVTTPRLDRDDEILLPDGAVLDDFRASPSVLFGHDYGSLPIGRDAWIKVTRKGILAKTIYAQHQFAEDVFQCVKGGFLNSNSVGFIPVSKVTPDDKLFGPLVDMLEKDYGVPREEAQRARNIYTKWILLEHSDVPIASNSQSLNLAVSKNELVIQSPSLKAELGIGIEAEPESESTPAAPAPKEVLLSYAEAVAKTVDKQMMADAVTKPETTDNYHRIPVSEGHDGHEIKTITVSADEGIKALYCVTCKEIKTYLFDVDKFSMAEAEAWVEEHKKTIDERYFGRIDEAKDADPAPPSLDFAALMARLDELTRKVDALKPTEPPPVPTPAPAPAPADVIEIDREDEIDIDSDPDIDIDSIRVLAAAVPSAGGVKSIPAETIEAAITQAVNRLNLKTIVAEAVDLSIARLRGKVK